jgi:myo-inositol 2-dehydrogenase/D-chiro-inositol 1-dehydrogenase
MGRTHLDALQDADGVAITAAVDPVAATRATLAQRGVAVHDRLEALIGAGGFDAALVAAPSARHGEIVAALAGAGVPILCEKPCGLSAADAAQAARVAAGAGVLLEIGYWRRFVPELIALRERIAAGELGDVALMRCWQWDGAPPAAEFRARSGGIAVDMGVHELDQLRWLTGQELGELHALAAGVAAGPPIPGEPDAAEIVVALSGGALGSISLGRTFAHGDCCWLEVHGLRGHARAEFAWGSAGRRIVHGALAAQAEAFAAAVRGDARPQGASVGDAIAALEAAERAQEQLATASIRSPAAPA